MENCRTFLLLVARYAGPTSQIGRSWMNANLGLVRYQCWHQKPLLLTEFVALFLVLVVGLTGYPVLAAADPLAPLQGYVHSTKHGQPHQLSGSYYLLVLADSPQAQPLADTQVQQRLDAHLRRAGYAQREEQMELADVVLVARLGVRADTPSLDAVLAGTADPDASLPTGVRYLQLEAYDLPEYLEFLRQHAGAAEDISVQFQTWRTTVESRGLLSEYAQVLPVLLQVATQRMGTEMAAIERFVLSANGLQLDPA